ncbi:MAG: glycosyltransferase family 4 protein [Elainellaceae cyanobacterium]
MRIAYVCADPGIPVFGQKGCSIHVQEVIRAFQQLGATVELFATRIGGEPPADLAAVKVHRLPEIPKGEPAIREQVAIAINPDLRLELELAGPFDLVYERYSLWSYSAMEYAQSVGIPGVLEVNSPLITEQATHRGLSDRAGAERVAQRVFQAAMALVAVSREVKIYLSQFVTDDRIHVIPNGVNPDRFPLSLQPSLPSVPNQFTVGFVGSLKPWHGLPVLIDAFDRFYQQVPSARLLIVGHGPERARLEADLRDRGLEAAVHLTGAVAPTAIPGLLASMDVAVAPYREQTDFYFSPLKVYEYMAAGLPVVTSQIGQLPDLITPDVNGILCSPGDAAALADALLHLWRSPNQRDRLGQAARQTVLQTHTWNKIARQILQLAGLTPAPIKDLSLSLGAR